MKVELSHYDLVNLVSSIEPNYNIMTQIEDRELGRYEGGFGDRWTWNKINLYRLEDSALLELYYQCKASWTK